MAQVIDTRGVLNAYMINQQRRALIEQRENQMLQEMVMSYDPNKQKGLQAKDVGDYQNLYTQWKQLHLSNKDLMKNPAKYPDLYRKSEQLKSQMGTVARLSEQDAGFWGNFSKMYSDPNQRDKFMDGSVTAVYNARNMPVMEQMRLRGKTFDWSDVELKFNPPDSKTIFEEVEIAGAATNQMEVGERVLSYNPNSYEERVVDFKKIKPEAVQSAYVNATNRDKNISKGYGQMFSSMKPEDIAFYQQKVKEATGIDFLIKSGDDLGKADWMIRGSYIEGKERSRTNDKLKLKDQENAKIRAEQRELNNQKILINEREQSQIRVKQTPGAVRNTKPQDDALYKDAVETNKLLSKGAGYSQVKSLVGYVNNMVQNRFRVLSPKTVAGRTQKEKEEEYVRQYRKALNEVYGEDQYLMPESTDGGNKKDTRKQRGDKWIRESFRRGASVVFVPFADKDGNFKGYTVIDPLEKNANEKLFNVMNKDFQIGRKTDPTLGDE